MILIEYVNAKFHKTVQKEYSINSCGFLFGLSWENLKEYIKYFKKLVIK